MFTLLSPGFSAANISAEVSSAEYLELWLRKGGATTWTDLDRSAPPSVCPFAVGQRGGLVHPSSFCNHLHICLAPEPTAPSAGKFTEPCAAKHVGQSYHSVLGGVQLIYIADYVLGDLGHLY